jgi:CheY-like chemotaxis protein
MQEIAKKFSGLNVLFVEDNIDLQQTTSLVLGALGANVVIASDGLIGLEKFTNEAFDFIVTDINMPNMDGIEMIREIRTVHNSNIPIVILSAQTDQVVEHIEELNVNGFIPKPLSVDVLKEVFMSLVLNK